jgi:adenosylhomocysteine nucleosidase
MALLYIAAEASELAPLAGHLTGLRPLKWPLAYAQEGILDGRRVLLAANGAGPKLAADALEIAIRAITAADLGSSLLEAVVSIGLCGGLDAKLHAGQIVVATEVRSAAEVFTAYPVESELPFVSGVVFSQDRVATTTAEKVDLHARYEAIAVEMEASGVAARAKRAQLPFWCIKAVADGVDQSFGIDFNQSRSHEGRIRRGKIVLQALAKPSVIPELFRLKRTADSAAGALGDFLVNCRLISEPAGNVVRADSSTDAG